MEEKKNLTHKVMLIYLSLYSMPLTSIKEKMKRDFLHQSSLHSKRFHLVSEQRKTGFGHARNETRVKK